MASHNTEPVSKRKHVEYDQKCVEERKSGPTEACRRGYPREDTPPAQCSVLCGPRSCSTLPSTLGSQNDSGTSPPEPKRRRLWGLRGLVKMFRRRVKRKGASDPSECPEAEAPTLRARSASELTVDANIRSSSGPYNQGLSVSHDSVFSPESPTEQTHTAPPGLSLATRGVNMSELKAALRRRRGLDSGSVEDDSDDPGLPRSPETSPTTVDVLNHGLKSSSRCGQSSCSDGSLLSMGSSENDEDSFGLISHHSSKHSLIEGRQVVDNEPAVGAAPLSHKAARHKISVRPKRTHGVPRARKQAQVSSSLPATPEVNEEASSRSASSGLNASFSPPSRQAENQQRPSSISFSSIETHVMKSRTEELEDRRNIRKSLPEPSSYFPEERKDEPLLGRLFGSVRSGLKEGHESPPTKDSSFAPDGVRVSREKRKDPFRASTSVKSSRQKSDPSRLLQAQQQHQQQQISPPSERNGGSSQRSSSVEGRLEGNLSDEAFDSPSSTQYPLVERELNSYIRREEESEVVLRRAVVGMDKQEATSTGSRGIVLNRLSSSYDNLDSDEVLPEALLKKQSINSIDSCEGRSSTDSLTTTPLPGIYIRSNHSVSKQIRASLQHQTKENLIRRREEQILHAHSRQHHMEGERDMPPSGPMSLDSSLNAVHYEDYLRKSISVDEVTAESEPRTTVPLSSASRPITVLRSASVHSSTSSSRGSSGRSRKSSIGDELESDSSLPMVSLRKLKREPSFKKPAEETETGAVPEFMRIQLNRVQNKGNAIIYDTDQSPQTSKTTPTAPRDIIGCSQVRAESTGTTPPRNEQVSGVNRGNKEESEKPREQSEIIIEEKNLIEVTAKQEGISPSVCTKSSEIANNAVNVGSRAPVSNQLSSGKGANLANSQNEEQQKRKDEIVLRRPSVVDRAIVIDQTMGALPSSPTPTKAADEPELFKVFARRSFKLKDAEIDALVHNEPTNNEMDKENHMPTPFNRSPSDGEQSSVNTMNIDRSSNTSSTIINGSSPSLKNISTKRYSLGNVTPPFVSSIDNRSTVIVLSGNNSTPTTHIGTNTSPAGNKEIEPNSAYHIGQKVPQNTVVSNVGFTRSKSHSPNTPKSNRMRNVEMDGSVSSSSEDNVEVNITVNETTANVKKVDSFSKQTAHHGFSPNVSSPTPISNQIKRTSHKLSDDTADSMINKDVESSPSFNSAIVRRSVHTTSSVVSTSPSDSSSSMDGLSPSTTPPTKPFRGQTVIWPPRNQPANAVEPITVTPPPADVSRGAFVVGRSSGRTKTESSPQTTEETPIKRTTPTGGSVEPRKPSLSECRRESNLLLAESRNTTFSHSFDSSSSPLAIPYLGRLERKGSADEGRNSMGGAEDWRVLVRQRREDRMKQTKTPEAEEIILEARPNVSRSSKVLEMAHNFQKLQVA